MTSPVQCSSVETMARLSLEKNRLEAFYVTGRR